MTALQTTEDVVSWQETDAAARELVQRLHDEAMQQIADLAENWDAPAPAAEEPDEQVSVLDRSELPAPPSLRPVGRPPADLAGARTDEIAVPHAA